MRMHQIERLCVSASDCSIGVDRTDLQGVSDFEKYGISPYLIRIFAVP